MKKFFFLIIVLAALTANAQISKVSLQASGLTCSMCSNAINKALKSLDFVNTVDANIKNSTFEIQFRQGSMVDFDRLKKKVEDAGFFVANFKFTIGFDNMAITNDACVTVGNTVYQFSNVKEQTLTGNKTLRVLDKGYVPAKEYKKNGNFSGMACDKKAGGDVKRVFHVTLT
jgi:copper chaperone CopZ